MIALYIFLGLLGLVVLLLLAAVIRTLCMKQKVSAYKAPEAGERAEAYAEKLAEMVRSETVSHSGVHETEKFYKFQELLRKLFPQRENNTVTGRTVVCFVASLKAHSEAFAGEVI